MCKILSRFEEISRNEGITISALEKKIGASKGVLSRAIAKGTDIQAKWIEAAVENYPQYSAEWLLTGNGPMLKSARTSTHTIIPITKSKEKILEVSEIPLYGIDVSAGLNKLFSEGGELLGKISVPNMPRCDGAVHVIGDSMYPLLKSGDIIAYKTVNDLQSINYGEIYILQLENEGDVSIVVKYIKRSEKGQEYILLVSYNKEHDPKEVPLTWVKAIARVTFCIRRFSII